MGLSEKLTQLKTENGLTTEMLAALSGVPKGTINKLLNGETQNPTMRTLRELARALGCPPETLLGDAPAQPLPDYENILEVARRRVPVLTGGAGETPLESGETAELPLAGDIDCDFALRAPRAGSRIREGDLVFVRRQPDVPDGQLAAVAVRGEVLLLRVYHMPGGLTLVPETADQPPMVIAGGDLGAVAILGRAVAFLGRL